MWMMLGSIVVVTGGLNLIFFFLKRNVRWLGFISLAFTSLTLCAFNSVNASFVADADWGSLMDVTPALTNALWVCVIISILINSVSLFKLKER